MWLICVYTFLTLEVVLTKDINRQEYGSFLNRPPEGIALDNNNGVSIRELRWPQGVVQYYLDLNSFDQLVAERVRMAMTTIEETSCVRFEPILTPWSDSHWIHITNKDGVRECVHDTAVNGSSTLEIVMTMGIECMQRRDILHLLMHALGFNDEITHPQRDQYVRILWDNINPAYRPLFRIRYEEFSSRQTEYDPMSIMHFHDRAFTMNGQATIQPLIPGLVINPSWELSPLDKMKLRLMFGHECNRREVNDLLDSCKNAIHNEKGGHSKNEANEDDSDYDQEVDNDIKEEVSEQKEEVDEQQGEEDASKYKNLESLGETDKPAVEDKFKNLESFETEKPAIEDKFKNLDYVETEKPAVREATIIV